jgi:hypothetical protein
MRSGIIYGRSTVAEEIRKTVGEKTNHDDSSLGKI